MHVAESIRTMMSTAGLSVRGIAAELGKCPYYMKHFLYRGGTPSVSNFAKIADVCGYDVLIRRRDDGTETPIDPYDD